MLIADKAFDADARVLEPLAADWQQVFAGSVRDCDDCDARQVFDGSRREWLPEVNPICPGDGRDSSRRRRPKPSGAPERTRELECA